MPCMCCIHDVDACCNVFPALVDLFLPSLPKSCPTTLLVWFCAAVLAGAASLVLAAVVFVALSSGQDGPVALYSVRRSPSLTPSTLHTSFPSAGRDDELDRTTTTLMGSLGGTAWTACMDAHMA